MSKPTHAEPETCAEIHLSSVSTYFSRLHEGQAVRRASFHQADSANRERRCDDARAGSPRRPSSSRHLLRAGRGNVWSAGEHRPTQRQLRNQRRRGPAADGCGALPGTRRHGTGHRDRGRAPATKSAQQLGVIFLPAEEAGLNEPLQKRSNVLPQL